MRKQEFKFKYEDVDESMAKHAPKPKVCAGMRFRQFAWVYTDGNNIDANFKNPARSPETIAKMHKRVNKIRKFINEGNYRGHCYTPPVINRYGKLIAGHHRYNAHAMIAGNMMWAAVCDFDDEKAERLYNSLENDDDDSFDKVLASVSDKINTLINQVNLGDIEKDESSIRKVVNKLKIFSPDEKTEIVKKVTDNFGIVINQMSPFRSKRVIKEFLGFRGNENIDEESIVCASISKNDTILTNVRDLQSPVVEKLMENPVVHLLLDVKCENPKELKEQQDRLLKKDLNIKKVVKIMRRFVKMYDEGKLGELRVSFRQAWNSLPWVRNKKVKTV